MSFWTDEKVLDEFTPEDKYFYVYLFTNPQTNLCGCYELGWTTTTGQLGYSKDTVLRLLDRFENVHKVIRYSKSTKEVLLLNWWKYNWTKSAKLDKPLLEQIKNVKSSSFKMYLMELYDNRKEDEDTVCIPYEYPMDTTVTVTDTITENYSDSIKEIIDYINIVTNSNYKYSNKSNTSKIKARLDEGHTVEEFKTVIDKKWNDWKDDPKMVKFVRPETLFASSHFESYLNEKVASESDSRNEYIDRWANV